MAILTLNELVEKVPVEFQPFARQYGPVFLAMSMDDLREIIRLLAAGDTEAPLRAALGLMTLTDLDLDAIAFTAADTQHANDSIEQTKARWAAVKTAASMLATIVWAII